MKYHVKVDVTLEVEADTWGAATALAQKGTLGGEVQVLDWNVPNANIYTAPQAKY